MKANPLFILAGSVLWLGTIIGAYQFGHRQNTIQPPADAASANAGGGNSRKRGGYPHNGEIDIMEHLNSDPIYHHTVHSNYTLNLGQKRNPAHTGTTKLNIAEFNTFGLEWFRDKLVFTCNGGPGMTYPKITTEKPGQWPFDQPFYLLTRGVGHIFPGLLGVKVDAGVPALEFVAELEIKLGGLAARPDEEVVFRYAARRGGAGDAVVL